MAIGRVNTGGGGGAGLSFSVVGGTTQPTGKENLIWVNTDTAITGWAFSSTQPTGTAGLVWLQTDKTSAVAFNALKKNGLWIYPTGCQQYVSDAWVAKTAKTYQSGAWVDWWDGELYDAGNEYTTQTGGWSSFEPLQYGAGTMTKNTDNLYVQAQSTADGWKSGAWGTGIKMNLSNYTTLHVTTISASGGSGDSCTKFGITDEKNTSSWNDTPNAVLTTGENTLDISSVNDGYVWVGAAQRASGTKTVTVTKIWLT